MRLFAAVSPPPDVVAALDAALGDRADALRWVPPHQWHLTLAFYGEVDPDLVAGLGERLERAAGKSSALALRLHGAGTFPRQQAKARVVWVGVDGDVEPLTRLAERCAAAARRVGLAIDDRVFRPHLTVARARRVAVDARDVVARLASYESEPWTVGSLRLVHSTLGSVVQHETLRELALATSTQT